MKIGLFEPIFSEHLTIITIDIMIIEQSCETIWHRLMHLVLFDIDAYIPNIQKRKDNGMMIMDGS